MPHLRQSTAQDVVFGAFIDDTDFNTPETTLTITQSDMQLSKNGGAYAQKSAVGNASHLRNGDYRTTLSTTDTNTIGVLRLQVLVTGALIVWKEWEVITQEAFDAKYGARAQEQILYGQINDATPTGASFSADGFTEATDNHFNGQKLTFITGALKNQSRHITDYTGSTQTFTFETPFVDAGIADDDWFVIEPGNGLGSEKAFKFEQFFDNMNSSSQFLSGAFATNFLTAAKVAADVSAQHADAVWDEDIVAAHGGADSAGLILSELTRRAVTFNADVADGSVVGQLADNGTESFDRASDSLQAIRDRGDAAWTTGAGGSPPDLLQSTTIATLASQVSFTLTAGSADDGAYAGATAVIVDGATAVQKAVGLIASYTGASKTVTLAEDPGVFTMAVGDTINIIAAPKQLPDAVHGANGGLITGDANNRIAGIQGTTNTLDQLNDLSAAEVKAQADQALIDYDGPTKTEMDAGFAALNDLSAAEVKAQADQALIDYDGPTKLEMDAGFAALNDISRLEVKVEADQALIDYDGPTNAELVARTLPAAAYFDPAADQVIVGVNTDKAGYSLASDIRLKKNTAFANFPFVMYDSADHVTPKTGLTVSAERAIGAGAFAACANAVVENANGHYRINLNASDLNGDAVTLRFTAVGADDLLIPLLLQTE